MRHILLLGVGPLPFYQSDKMYGFGIRAWQFALPLLKAGHHITLVTLEFGAARESDIKVTYQFPPACFGSIEHITLPEPSPRTTNILLTKLEEIIRSYRPDAIIAAGSTITTNLAAMLNTSLPIWMDMFGDLFAEVQAKSPFVNARDQITFFHHVLSRVLLRGDRFSVVSEMQRGAAMGQLGLMGRLNQYTLGEELVYTIPCAVNGDVMPVKQKTILRGKVVERGDFLLLCTGGFNTWMDVPTLFEGIERAMEKNPRIHCVVTGGAIVGHHEDGFTKFRGLISKSPHEKNFHLLGWLSNEDVDQVTMECDLGLNVDLPIYESYLGSRNRMLYWMQFGLPVLTTLNTELSHVLFDNDIAIGVPHSQPRLLADKIVEASLNRRKVRRKAMKAQEFTYQYFSFDETCLPLVRWVEHPATASDIVQRSSQGKPLSDVDALWHAWAFEGQRPQDSSSVFGQFRTILRIRPQGKNWWDRLMGK